MFPVRRMLAKAKNMLCFRGRGAKGPTFKMGALDFTLQSGGVPLPDPALYESDGAVPEMPSYIAVEVTNACNLRCVHCNYRHGLDHYTRDRGFVSDEVMERALTEAAKHKMSVLMNYDGEPLLHKSFLKYLKRASELDLVSYFNTNGTLFDKNFADELLKFYKKGSVFFSVDGSKEWLEKIRVPASYEQVVGNVNYFLEANKKAGWPVTVGVSLCNFGQSAEERKAFFDKWFPLANYVSMGEVNDKFGTITSDRMTKFTIPKRPLCSVPWQTMGICFDGSVIPCSIYVTRANTANAIFGNVLESSLRDIWHGENYKKFRNALFNKETESSYCDKCNRWICQFSFPDVEEGNCLIKRNGMWTTFQNLEKGKLNFGG